jgi:hypothetical protein
MGLLGGDSTLQNALDLANAMRTGGHRLFGSGSGNYVKDDFESKQTSEQVASQEKKDSMDLAASVGVGVGGGSGSGGTVDKYTGGETDVLSVGKSTLSSYLPYILILGSGLLVIMLMKRKK